MFSSPVFPGARLASMEKATYKGQKLQTPGPDDSPVLQCEEVIDTMADELQSHVM